MRIFENPGAAAELIRRATEYRQVVSPRAEGLHVSDLIYCRRKAWYRARLRASGQTFEEHDTDTLVMFLLGHGYHALLEQGDEERKVVLNLPVEVGLVLPVHGTVDHVERVTCDDEICSWSMHATCERLIPHEFKTTRASAAKPIDSVQHYIEQVAAYCLGLDATRGVLSVIYINGSYNKDGSGMKPTIKTYDLGFDVGELRAWQLELAARAWSLIQNTPPPLPCHRTWECSYCPFNAKVGGPCPGGPGIERHWFLSDALPSFVSDVLESS